MICSTPSLSSVPKSELEMLMQTWPRALGQFQCKLYYLSLNVLPSFFSPSYPTSFSTAVGVTAEIQGRGRVEAVQKEASLRSGSYSMCSDFRPLPK